MMKRGSIYKTYLGATIALLLAFGVYAANEVKLTVKVDVDKGNLEIDREVNNYKSNMTGDNYTAGVQNISTNPAALTVGTGVGTAGYAYMRNLGTNDMYISFTALLKSNDVALVRVSSTVITAVLTNSASTATSPLDYLVLEE
jgi:hypothetical protein